MVSSVVALCNLALVRAGQATITALDEGSAESDACSLLYEQVRDELLADAPWLFARARQSLAQLSSVDTPPQWAYAFQLPTDCLSALYIEPAGLYGSTEYYKDGALYLALPALQQVVPFETVEGRVLFTNQDSVTLAFTRRISDVTKFPQLFATALSWRLAAELCTPLSESLDKASFCDQQANKFLNKAKVASANEASAVLDQDAMSIRARL